MMARAFDPKLFTAIAGQRGLLWGTPLDYRETTASTNDDALEAARTGAPEGSLFVTDHQTRGRGRHGRQWWAEPGDSLLFSLLLRPNADVSANTALTLAIGLGVRNALAPFSRSDLGIKWPNDIVVGEHKLAGILCEGQLEHNRLTALVIGVGINVYSSPPVEAHMFGTCLVELGTPPRREQLLVEILLAIQEQLRKVQERGLPAVLAELSAHDALRGQEVTITGAHELRGQAQGIDGQGNLLVLSEHGLRTIASGTVVRVR
jgi:BirA family transcriptional regulator, biotin operon repressor / biotin---[acetyl-CoA-carboxylase] ligase